ncbi:SDR family NAD(P)-dependent oxidoreductase [Streptomyces sp. CB01580]|uniref:SDR family NAD(P)-dependent oxidoreductase n=1 Tax=Streptomyces sp. CB01580 TaxID=1703933 RepID=UPI00093E4A3F|nr:SDR family NAD(P)-dependent oxidoreductase [Streptomyces sp. CB01580]OKJ25818.1 short-chain dehydrogenase [Streptomyces sp. CB01580]
MNTGGAIALVAGANRGLGRAFARGLLAHGARTVYAAAHDTKAVTGAGLTPLVLDITDPASVAAAAERCPDTTLVVNNAGIQRDGSLLTADSLDGARDELETNLFGKLAMCRAFAPVLGKNDGGALINALSVLSWHTLPQIGSSKATAWSMTNAVREDRRAQDTLTIAVHAAFIDTDIAAHVDQTKISPADVVDQVLDAVEAVREEAPAEDVTRQARAMLSRGANHDH